MKHLYFFVGRPGSGKETQSRLLAEKLGYQMFSTGIEFRKMIASGTPLGNKIKGDYEKGVILPAWFADYMFENFVLNLPEDAGAVFEGSGRDKQQAETIEKVCGWLGRPYTVFNLDVKEETVIARSLARKRDSTDSEEVIKNRLAEYNRLTGPAIDAFKSYGTCVDINGELTPEGVHEEVIKNVAS